VSFTFYWHDYETFGANPAKDRPSQFAGVRTDADFNIIGEPLTIYCKPAKDMLPHPEACLITGILPQEAAEKGVPEAEFIRQIHQEMAQPGTCVVGYNSIRFDDEVTRYTLYRNFYDPYAREYKNGSSRWDLIDLVRVCRALRPEGIEWPNHEDGSPSFKLEHLTEANGIGHESAHDAMSDVIATIELAKLIKQKQPKLFDYIFQLRSKKKVSELLDVVRKKPVLHTSAMFPSTRFCTTLWMPLATHPTNNNGVMGYDLTVDPTPLIELNAEQIRQRLFTPKDQLPEGVERIPLKTLHTNRCPVIATSKLLDDAAAQRLQIDLPQCRQHYQQLMQAAGLEQKLADVFLQQEFAPQTDPDVMLYSGGFWGANDKQTMNQIRSSSPEQLATGDFHFDDKRLPTMLFRYRARNYPESLNADEQLQWQDYCFQRLTDPEAGGGLVMDDFMAIIDEKLASIDTTEQQRKILEGLLAYSDELLV